jgi:hypothetical protein
MTASALWACVVAAAVIAGGVTTERASVDSRIDPTVLMGAGRH